MADDIKIKVGVASSVKRDMDQVVADVTRSREQMNRPLEALLGRTRAAPEVEHSQQTLEALLARAKAADPKTVAALEEARAAQDDNILGNLKYSAQSQAAAWKAESDKITDALAAAGKTGRRKFDDAFAGSGVRGALTRLVRGDISGAIQSISDMMGAGMRGVIGKGVVWGGGIATALLAGFRAGQFVDKMVGDISKAFGGTGEGLSDRLAKMIGGAKVDVAIDARLKALRALRSEAEKAHKATQAAVEAFDKIGDRVTSAVLDKENAGTLDRLEAEQRKLSRLIDRANEVGGTGYAAISGEERQSRTADVEEQRAVVARLERQAAAEFDARRKADFEQQQAAEKEAAERRARSEEFIAEMVRKTREQKAAAMQEQLQAIEKEKAAAEKAHKKGMDALDARKDKLRELVEKGKRAAQAAMDNVNDPAGWRRAEKDKKDKDRQERRRRFQLDQWADMEKRGIKLPPRAVQALADADKANLGLKAAAQLEQLEIDAQKAQIAMQGKVEMMEGHLAKMQGKLDTLLQVGGGN